MPAKSLNDSQIHSMIIPNANSIHFPEHWTVTQDQKILKRKPKIVSALGILQPFSIRRGIRSPEVVLQNNWLSIALFEKPVMCFFQNMIKITIVKNLSNSGNIHQTQQSGPCWVIKKNKNGEATNEEATELLNIVVYFKEPWLPPLGSRAHNEFPTPRP